MKGKITTRGIYIGGRFRRRKAPPPAWLHKLNFWLWVLIVIVIIAGA